MKDFLVSSTGVKCNFIDSLNTVYQRIYYDHDDTDSGYDTHCMIQILGWHDTDSGQNSGWISVPKLMIIWKYCHQKQHE